MLEINKTRSQNWGRKVGRVCGKGGPVLECSNTHVRINTEISWHLLFLSFSVWGDHVTWQCSRGIPIIPIRTRFGLNSAESSTVHLSIHPLTHPSNWLGAHYVLHLVWGAGCVKVNDVQILKSGREERNIKRDWQVRALVQDQGRLSEGWGDSFLDRGKSRYKGKTSLGNPE